MGKRLKDPYKPIWVVNSGSHFSVLFGSDLGLAERESGAMGAPAPDLAAQSTWISKMGSNIFDLHTH